MKEKKYAKKGRSVKHPKQAAENCGGYQNAELQGRLKAWDEGKGRRLRQEKEKGLVWKKNDTRKVNLFTQKNKKKKREEEEEENNSSRKL